MFIPSRVTFENEERCTLIVVSAEPPGPLLATPACRLNRARGLRSRIGRSSICFFSTVPVTSELVVLTISAPASTITDSTFVPTSRVIGGEEEFIWACHLIVLVTA